MLEGYSGKTRIFPVIGDPIAQVKSPVTMTRGFEARGVDAIVVPVHVSAEDVSGVIDMLAAVKNVDGIIATVPHKFTAFQKATTATSRSRILGAANLLRRNADGTWHADMVDGISFVWAAERKGCRMQGAKVLLIGAGGAGSAIGLQLLASGVADLAIHDADTGRRDALIGKLAGLGLGGRVGAGSTSARGRDIVVNATPSGMGADDPLPVDVSTLTADTFVGDVITAPEMTPLLEAGKAIGCRFSIGVEMVGAAVDIQADFLLGKDVP